MNSVFPPGSCCTDGAGEGVLELAGSLSSGLGSGQVQDRGRERGSNSGSISACGGGIWAMSGSNRLPLAKTMLTYKTNSCQIKQISYRWKENETLRSRARFKLWAKKVRKNEPLVSGSSRELTPSCTDFQLSSLPLCQYNHSYWVWCCLHGPFTGSAFWASTFEGAFMGCLVDIFA